MFKKFKNPHNIRVSRILRKIIYFIANFYWKVFGGIIFALIWAVVATALTLTVVGFPLAVKLYKIAYMSYKPFGKVGITQWGENAFWGVIWFTTLGIPMALFAVLNMLLNALTVLGLPIAYQWLKLTKLSLFPFSTAFPSVRRY